MNIPYAGVKYLMDQMAEGAEPIHYFKLYFTDAVIDIIRQETIDII